jgi:uncharacterized protein (UPF0297 family)
MKNPTLRSSAILDHIINERLNEAKKEILKELLQKAYKKIEEKKKMMVQEFEPQSLSGPLNVIGSDGIDTAVSARPLNRWEVLSRKNKSYLDNLYLKNKKNSINYMIDL